MNPTLSSFKIWRTGRAIWLALVLSVPLAAADDPLAYWEQHYNEPAVQQKILNRIFSGQIGPVSNAQRDKESGATIFPKNGGWVKLASKPVYLPRKSGAGPFFIATCMFYNQVERGPINATTYLVRNATDRPDAISGGYAAEEAAEAVELPKLGKTFVAIVGSFGKNNQLQWSGSVVSIQPSGKPDSVWITPMSARRFQFGFAQIGGKVEELVFRYKKSGEDLQYSAYRWNGSRFEPDGFASLSTIKALPSEVWKYGGDL